jgi:hypothetical protein
VLKVLIAEDERMTDDEAGEILNRQDHEVCGMLRTVTDAVIEFSIPPFCQAS